MAKLDGCLTYKVGCDVNKWQHTGFINCMYPAHSSLLMSQIKLGTKPLSNFANPYSPVAGPHNYRNTYNAFLQYVFVVAIFHIS